MRIGRYILGLLLGPILTIIMLIPLLFIGPGPVFSVAPLIVFFAYISLIYVPVYGTVVMFYSIKSLLSLILLANFIPLAMFGIFCFRNGYMNLFSEWNDKYKGMLELCPVFSFWAFVLWLFVRERRSIKDSDS